MSDKTYIVDQSNRENLVKFLNNLSISIETGELPPDQIRRIGEFYMKYKFEEQADIDNDFDKEDFTQEEFQKFLVLGWYFYRVLTRNEPTE